MKLPVLSGIEIIKVLVKPSSDLRQKKEAYQNRFPFLWKKVGFKFIEF